MSPMTIHPLVSVIIPTFNCARHIASAIASVKRQTYENLEIVVVDDGSQDDTRQVVEGLDDCAIRYVHQRNQGVAQARNTGILAARGEFVAYVDADDELDASMIETCYAAMVRDDSQWCVTDILKVRTTGHGREEVVAPSPVPDADHLYHILTDDFVLRAPFFRRDALISIGLYDARLLTREDWDMSVRLIRAGRRFSYLPEPLYHYHFRDDSLMRKSKRLSYDCTLLVLQKHHRQLADAGDRRAKKIYAASLWWLGRNYLVRERCIMRCFYCLKESIRYDFNGSLYLTTLRNLLGRACGSG